MKTGLIFCLAVVLCMCRSKYQLHQNDRAFIPYAGNEVLVFESDSLKDTFHLAGFESYYMKDHDEQSRFTSEHRNLLCKRSQDEDQTFFLIGLTATKGNRTIVSFNISKGDEPLFFWNAVSVDSMKQMRREAVYPWLANLTDVVCISNRHPDTTGRNIRYLYWSFSKGIVAYELYNGARWTLAL